MGWALNPMTNVLIRNRRGDDTGKGEVYEKTEITGMNLTAPEAGRAKEQFIP